MEASLSVGAVTQWKGNTAQIFLNVWKPCTDTAVCHENRTRFPRSLQATIPAELEMGDTMYLTLPESSCQYKITGFSVFDFKT